jgi:CRP-like cAMP-binding protein
VARLTTTTEVAAGRELITEGQIGQELFVVLDGEAEVRKGDTLIATRGPGSIFGETALLVDRPRNATVVARTDMTVALIERGNFQLLLEEHPDLYLPLLASMANRLAEFDDPD